MDDVLKSEMELWSGRRVVGVDGLSIGQVMRGVQPVERMKHLDVFL